MTSPTLSRLCLAALALCLAGGCATSGLPAVSAGDADYDWFRTPDPLDAWSPKIEGWQSREAVEVPFEAGTQLASVSVSGTRSADRSRRSPGELREKYVELRRSWKRKMAEEVADWIQQEAPHHYRPDGPIDHWATLDETLERNGDDCDGLELLVFQFLRDLGFRDDEVFRAIVYRPSDGQHHMVTLWFESPSDPFVIDPTGAMTRGMPRMSDVPGWVPLKVFTETEEFTVAPRSTTASR
ncbi:MAG: hypothetical protein QNK05_03255 [Myxococcota bacterium]|nr:hypothetical protein [Myxococcota bacterium]